ncbi:MAG: hypothetical protein IJ523_07160 [Succinivibrionaceae bacterium]|nr:hypothetical protein [Succinivibrionaceae bacterium]
MITTTILAVRATPEALRRIEAKKRKERHKKLTVIQTVQATWLCYIPAGVTGTVSVACLVGASVVNGRRNAALATAYSLAENTLRDYRSKVVETIGEKKEEAILDAIDRDRIERNPPPPNGDMPMTEGAVAPVLCMDAMFGRYFYSDVETLKRAMNKLNWQMNNGCEPYISLNEFYMEIGLSTVDVGDDLGWRNDRGLIDLRFSSQLVNGHMPCLVMSHNNPPEYGYSEA